jgi:predicted membrane-bound spermidine synthase
LVVQATSQEALPSTFGAVHQTLRSAGLVVTSYEAPIPLLGAISFLVGSRESAPRREAQALPAGLRFLDAAALQRATMARGEPVPASISTLGEQRLIEIWHDEQARLGN